MRPADMTAAAQEVHRLKAEVEKLKADLMHTRNCYLFCDVQAQQFRAEIKRLKKVCREQAGVELSEENDRLIDELARKRTELRSHVREKIMAALYHMAALNYGQAHAVLTHLRDDLIEGGGQ